MSTNCFILRKYIKCTIYDLENLLRRTISLSSPRNFNDPLDSYFMSYSHEVLNKLNAILSIETRNSVKMACFCNQESIIRGKIKEALNNDEILMWTHYANAHRGICLEYSIPRNDFNGIEEIGSFDNAQAYLEEVKYVEDLAVNYTHVFNGETNNGRVSTLLKSIYFLKDQTFSYEHEFRLLKFISAVEPYTISTFDYLKKIIFGIRCSKDTKNLISCINKQIYEDKIELYNIDSNFRELPYEQR